MAVTTAVLSGTIDDLVGSLDPKYLARITLVIEANTPGSLLIDTAGNRHLAGAKRVPIDKTSGAYSVTLVTTNSADVVPTTGRLYRATLIYPSGTPGAGNVTQVSGWFQLTADASLADIWPGLATTAVATTVYENMTDSLMTGIDSNSASGFRVQQDARLSATLVPRPTTDLGDWALLRRDTSDVTKGVAWTTPHIAVARVLGWRVVTDAQYAGGADPTGVADSLAAAQAAHDDLPAGGGKLYYPEGTFKHSGAVTVTKPCAINGTGYGTDIKTSSATANIFTVSAQFVEMCGLRFTSSVVRTAGWYVDVLSTASRFRIENFSMDGAIGGIRSAAVASCTIDHGMILNCTAGTGVAVRIDDGVDITINDLLVDSATQIYSGVYITNAGDVQITDSQIIHAGDGLRCNAGVGDVISSVWSCNTFYDNCTNGVILNAPGGSIVRSRFTSCWMASSTEWGVKLTSSAGGSVDGTDILGCHVFLNVSGGILLNDTGIHHTRIHDSAICENTGVAGILINAAVTDFSIIGNRIGDGYGFAGNGYGIYFNSASADYFQISNNDLTGNTITNIGGTVPTAGANRIISDNLGDATSGTVAGVTVTASPFTYTAGPRYETVCINGGTVSLVKVNGTAVFQQTNCTVRLAPGKSVEVSYTVAPGIAAIRD